MIQNEVDRIIERGIDKILDNLDGLPFEDWEVAEALKKHDSIFRDVWEEYCDG